MLQFCVKTTEYSVAVATLPSLSPPTLPLFLSTATAASDASTCSRVSELSFLSLQCLNVSSNSLVLTSALLLCLESRSRCCCLCRYYSSSIANVIEMCYGSNELNETQSFLKLFLSLLKAVECMNDSNESTDSHP